MKKLKVEPDRRLEQVEEPVEPDDDEDEDDVEETWEDLDMEEDVQVTVDQGLLNKEMEKHGLLVMKEIGTLREYK